MTTFYVFAFDKYYPQGGAKDLVGCLGSLEEAKDFALTRKEDLIQIFDCQTRKIVFEADRFNS